MPSRASDPSGLDPRSRAERGASGHGCARPTSFGSSSMSPRATAILSASVRLSGSPGCDSLEATESSFANHARGSRNVTCTVFACSIGPRYTQSRHCQHLHMLQKMQTYFWSVTKLHTFLSSRARRGEEVPPAFYAFPAGGGTGMERGNTSTRKTLRPVRSTSARRRRPSTTLPRHLESAAVRPFGEG